MTDRIPPKLDHLLFVAPDLEEGMDEVERLLGVRPAIGGRHPDFGTRNALLAIGERIYLEVIAPDPSLPEPRRGRLFDRGTVPAPRLLTWVLRDEDIVERVAAARAQGLDLGVVHASGRQTPDGRTLSWQASDPYAMPLGGAVPFVIAWGDTPHPATAAPVGGQLTTMRIEHPDPLLVSAAMEILGTRCEARVSEAFRIVATIRTPGGDVEVS